MNKKVIILILLWTSMIQGLPLTTEIIHPTIYKRISRINHKIKDLLFYNDLTYIVANDNLYYFDGQKTIKIPIPGNEKMIDWFQDNNETIHILTLKNIYSLQETRLKIEENFKPLSQSVFFSEIEKILYVNNGTYILQIGDNLMLYNLQTNSVEKIFSAPQKLLLRKIYPYRKNEYIITANLNNYLLSNNRLSPFKINKNIGFFFHDDTLYSYDQQTITNTLNDKRLKLNVDFKSTFHQILSYPNNSLIIKTPACLYQYQDNRMIKLVDFSRQGELLSKIFINRNHNIFAVSKTQNELIILPCVWIKNYILQKHISSYQDETVCLGRRHWLSLCNKGILEHKNKVLYLRTIESNKNSTFYQLDDMNDFVFFQAGEFLVYYDKKNDEYGIIPKKKGSLEFFNFKDRYYCVNTKDRNVLYTVDIHKKKLMNTNSVFKHPVVLSRNMIIDSEGLYQSENKKKIREHKDYLFQTGYAIRNMDKTYLLKTKNKGYVLLKNDSLFPIETGNFHFKRMNRAYSYKDTLYYFLKDTIFKLKKNKNTYSLQQHQSLNGPPGIFKLNYLTSPHDPFTIYILTKNKFLSYDLTQGRVHDELHFDKGCKDFIYDSVDNTIKIISDKEITTYSILAKQATEKERVPEDMPIQFDDIIDPYFYSHSPGFLIYYSNQFISFTEKHTAGKKIFKTFQDNQRDYYVFMNNGITLIERGFEKSKLFYPQIKYDSTIVMPENEIVKDLHSIPPGLKTLTFHFTVNSIMEDYQIYYRLNEERWNHISNNNQIQLAHMGAGDYKLEIRLVGENHIKSPSSLSINFHINYHWWQKWYNILLIFISSMSLIFIFLKIELKSRINKIKMDTEINSLKKIHQMIMPQQKLDHPSADFFVYHQPSFVLGGDYYELIPLPHNLALLILADISGHDIATSLILTNLRGFLSGYFSKIKSTRKLFTIINKFLLNRFEGDRYMTMTSCVIDQRNGTGYIASAGHPHPIHYSAAKDSWRYIDANTYPLGLLDHIDYKKKAVQYDKGDFFIFYTDGITDQLADILKNHHFDLISFLQKNKLNDPKNIINYITNMIEHYEKGDDMTIIITKMK